MAFNWTSFLDARRIEYVTSGPNVGRDHVAVRCPLCTNDPSHHMSISLTGEGWRCFRDHSHSGKNPAGLIRALLNCSWEQANHIAGNRYNFDSFSALLDKQERRYPPPLKLPLEFKVISDLPSCRPFIAYLRRRGFTDEHIATLSDRYGMRYCTQGIYHGRIIFTVIMHKKLYAWTGRSIYATAIPRYKTLSADFEKARIEGAPVALAQIKQCLLWYDDLHSGRADTIYLVEGPFDALRMRVLGAGMGITATCFFGAQCSKTQIDLLCEILPLFAHKYLLLDQDTFKTTAQVSAQLAELDVLTCLLPKDVKDPGEIKDLRQVVHSQRIF